MQIIPCNITDCSTKVVLPGLETKWLEFHENHVYVHRKERKRYRESLCN